MSALLPVSVVVVAEDEATSLTVVVGPASESVLVPNVDDPLYADDDVMLSAGKLAVKVIASDVVESVVVCSDDRTVVTAG